MKDQLTLITQQAGNGYVGGTLLAAGFVPTAISFLPDISNVQTIMQIVYFAVLIPPAAYHCYAWARDVLKKKQ